jgi:transposase
MQKAQKTYTAEFKREAVRLAQTSGKPITHVARELGISDTSIHQWRKELTEHSSEAFPGSGHQTAQEEEVRRLKRELDMVKQERDILKKRSASFRATRYEISVHSGVSAGVSDNDHVPGAGSVSERILRLV